MVATVAAVSQFDQAYRDNRQGFVIIADDLAREHEIELLKERIDIVKIEPDPIAGASRCYGYSIDFEPLILGASAPEYAVIFHKPDSTSPAAIVSIERRN